MDLELLCNRSTLAPEISKQWQEWQQMNSNCQISGMSFNLFGCSKHRLARLEGAMANLLEFSDNRWTCGQNIAATSREFLVGSTPMCCWLSWRSWLHKPICFANVVFRLHLHYITRHESPNIYHLKHVSGWCFGPFFICPYIGNVIIPSDSYFSEGLKPPSR